MITPHNDTRIDELFEERWKQVPYSSYNEEIKDLYRNFYEMGWKDGGSHNEDVADQ